MNDVMTVTVFDAGHDLLEEPASAVLGQLEIIFPNINKNKKNISVKQGRAPILVRGPQCTFICVSRAKFQSKRLTCGHSVASSGL